MAASGLRQMGASRVCGGLRCKTGSERALNFIVGLVTKKTRGKASPGEVHDLVKAEVEKA